MKEALLVGCRKVVCGSRKNARRWLPRIPAVVVTARPLAFGNLDPSHLEDEARHLDEFHNESAIGEYLKD